MANFGSNFTEAFTATYGLGLKRKQIQAEETRAVAAEKRAQETHDVQMAEARAKQEMRTRLVAAPNRLDDPANTSGLLSSEDYEAMKAPKPTQAATAPAVTTGAKPQKPSALPQMTPAPAPQVTDVAGIPAEAPAAKAAPQPEYTPVMVGNKIMYAPAERVKKLQGPELIRAQAEAISSLDPVVGAQLVQSANAIEGQNLELNSKRFAQGVLTAMRTAETDMTAGLGMLRDAYNQNMPDLGNVEFTADKKGGIKVDNYVDTAGGRKLISSRTIPAKDPETGLSARETLFRYALSLSSPEAYRQNIIDSSTLATQELNRVLSIKQDRREDISLGLRAQEVRARVIEALGGGNAKIDFAEDPVKYTGAAGQTIELPRYRVKQKNTKDFGYVYPTLMDRNGNPATLRPEYGADAVAVNNFLTRAKTLRWNVVGESDGRIYFQPNRNAPLKRLSPDALKAYGNQGRLYNDK